MASAFSVLTPQKHHPAFRQRGFAPTIGEVVPRRLGIAWLKGRLGVGRISFLVVAAELAEFLLVCLRVRLFWNVSCLAGFSRHYFEKIAS